MLSIRMPPIMPHHVSRLHYQYRSWRWEHWGYKLASSGKNNSCWNGPATCKNWNWFMKPGAPGPLLQEALVALKTSGRSVTARRR